MVNCYVNISIRVKISVVLSMIQFDLTYDSFYLPQPSFSFSPLSTTLTDVNFFFNFNVWLVWYVRIYLETITLFVVLYCLFKDTVTVVLNTNYNMLYYINNHESISLVIPLQQSCHLSPIVCSPKSEYSLYLST